MTGLAGQGCILYHYVVLPSCPLARSRCCSGATLPLPPRFLKALRRRSFDLSAAGRYVAFGSLFSAPVLFAWYRALDRFLPGATAPVVAKKVFLDATVLAIPYYSAFFFGMDFMEGQEHNVFSFPHYFNW